MLCCFVLCCTVHLGEAKEVCLVEALEAHPGLWTESIKQSLLSVRWQELGALWLIMTIR